MNPQTQRDRGEKRPADEMERARDVITPTLNVGQRALQKALDMSIDSATRGKALDPKEIFTLLFVATSAEPSTTRGRATRVKIIQNSKILVSPRPTKGYREVARGLHTFLTMTEKCNAIACDAEKLCARFERADPTLDMYQRRCSVLLGALDAVNDELNAWQRTAQDTDANLSRHLALRARIASVKKTIVGML